MDKIIILATIVMIAGCTTIAQSSDPKLTTVPTEDKHIDHKFSGDFPTDRVREMWIMCHRSSTKVQKFPSLEQHKVYCDCFLDTLREQESDAGLQTKTPEEFAPLFNGIAEKCRNQIIGNMSFKRTILIKKAENRN